MASWKVGCEGLTRRDGVAETQKRGLLDALGGKLKGGNPAHGPAGEFSNLNV